MLNMEVFRCFRTRPVTQASLMDEVNAEAPGAKPCDGGEDKGNTPDRNVDPKGWLDAFAAQTLQGSQPFAA